MKSIVKFIYQFIKQLQKADITGWAAQLAFFFLLSLFPLLIFLMTLLPYLPLSSEEVLSFFRTFAPGDTMQLIEANINDVMSVRSGKLLSIGIIATLWSASNGMNSIIKAINSAYGIEQKRSFIVTRLVAIVLMFLVIFVFIAALILQVFGHKIGLFLLSFFYVSDKFMQVWLAIRLLASSLIPFLIFTVIYWIVPNRSVRLIGAMPGAVFSTVGWAVSSLAFSYYVGNFSNYSVTYGSIGVIIVLMLWFYLSGMIIIIGGELNAFISKKRSRNLLKK